MSKLDQLRAFREAAAMRRENGKALRRPPLSNVTLPTSNVTSAKPKGSGRKKVFASGAQKQRAYRERLKANKQSKDIHASR